MTPHNANLTDVLKKFFMDVEQTRIAIHESTDAINRANTLNQYIEISYSQHLPRKICQTLENATKDFLAIDFKVAALLGVDKTDFLLTKMAIEEDIKPKLEVAAYDWENLFPLDKAHHQIQKDIQLNPDSVPETFISVSEAYHSADCELRDIVLQNAAFLMSDLEVTVK